MASVNDDKYFFLIEKWWDDYSALCNAVMNEVPEELASQVEMILQEKSSVYGRDLTEPPGWVSRVQSLDSAPRDGTYILLGGPSGYRGTPLRWEFCKYDAEYRPLQPWVTYSGDSFLDSGAEPTCWMPLPQVVEGE